MKIPLKYTLRNFRNRRLTTAITVVGIALVVFVFAAVLMMAYGIKKTLVATGSDENVMVTRKSSQGEISSIIDGDTRNVILTLPEVAKAPDGKPIASGEPVVVINLSKIGGGVSNKADLWLEHIETRARVVIAKMKNQAGIIGAALAAGRMAEGQEPTRLGG